MRKIITFLLLLVSSLYAAVYAQNDPPSTADIETWTISYTFVYDNTSTPDSESMKVAFDGADVYFNFPNPINGNKWMKGTIADNKATFAQGQLIGTYGGSSIYYAGLNESGLCDIVFTYDAEKQIFTLSNMWLLYNASLTESKPAAYLASATVTKEAPTPTPGGGSTPPSTAEIEDWTISYTFVYDGSSTPDSETMQVAIDGTDVYFNFPNPINGNKWMRGTILNGKATFPKGQLVGSYSGSDIYYVGLDENGLCDIVFNYDATKQTFTLGDMYLVLNSSTTQISALAYFSAATVTKEAPKPLEVVTPPDNLKTSEYAFSATRISIDPMTQKWIQESVRYNVNMGFVGKDVYLQGLCRELPTSWIKGSYDASDGEITFPSGQYYGKYHFDMFFAGATYPTTNPIWKDEVEFFYNTTSHTYSTSALLTLNSSATELNPYEFYAGSKLTKIEEKTATPAKPSVMRYVAYTNADSPGFMSFNIPTLSTTGDDLLTAKLGYQLFVEKSGTRSVYTFEKSIYTKLNEDMTIVPYNFSDSWDFYLGGTGIYFYEDLKDATLIGIQSVYTGGGAGNRSELLWFDPATINGISSTKDSQPVRETYTDLQGRTVPADAKGLLLKTIHMSDGTQKTFKVVKK